MLEKPFSAEGLRLRLEKLDHIKQMAFGASCCERLLPNYYVFQKQVRWGDTSQLRSALDFIWHSLLSEKVDLKEKIATLIASCEKVTPDSDDFDSLYLPLAQDGCLATINLLEHFLKPDAKKVVWAASYAIDSVDLYVQEIHSMNANAPDLEDKILRHKFMQRELLVQKEHLKMLEQITVLDATFLRNYQNSWSNGGKSNLDLF